MLLILLLVFAFVSCSPVETEKESLKDVVFFDDVARIMEQKCVPCHQKDGGAPFELTSYEAVSRKAKTIVEVTQKGIMPPWPADPSYQHFVGERLLTDQEKETFKAWVSQGKVKGKKERVLVARVAKGLQQNKPDLILDMPSIRLAAGDGDRFFLMRIPGQLDRDTWVKAMEIHPGVRERLHHFNGHMLNFKQAKPAEWPSAFQEITQGEYDADFAQLDLLEADGSRPERIHSAVNYLPGMEGTLFPDGIGGFRLSRQFALVGNDVHYGPSDADTLDRSQIWIWFADKEPKRKTAEFMLGTNGSSKIEPPLLIPAGQVTQHRTAFQVMADVSLLSINPHMHLLGSSLKAYAVKPSGDTVHLISIPRWDFRWQYTYTFTHMIRIPRGSWIVCEATYDNRSSNPNNPHSPPQTVGERLEYGGASMRASDEMLQLIIAYTPYQKGDETLTLQME
jgi:mono/diheme cytochrome c family protein